MGILLCGKALVFTLPALCINATYSYYSSCCVPARVDRVSVHALFVSMWKNRRYFQRSFTGFALYDTEREEMVYTYQANKYFTPASNTKIFTLFAGLKMLGSQLPGFAV